MPEPKGAGRFVWANVAASADGRIAFADGARAPLSSPEDLRRVQRIRAEVDAIVVGAGTVIKDDPSLRVHWELLGTPPERTPTRVAIVGPRIELPSGARILDGSIPTVVTTTESARARYPSHVIVVRAGKERVDLRAAFDRLAERGLRRLLVEGGSEVLASVVHDRLFDRLTVYHAPIVIGGRTAPPMIGGGETRQRSEGVALELVGVERLGEGFVATYVLPGRSAEGP